MISFIHSKSACPVARGVLVDLLLVDTLLLVMVVVCYFVPWDLIAIWEEMMCINVASNNSCIVSKCKVANFFVHLFY